MAVSCSGDFKGLKVLQEAAGNDFVCGIVVYTGRDVAFFGGNLMAVPVGVLWL